MEPELLGVYESDTAIVRIYTGPRSRTEEQRRALLEEAMLSYARALRRSSPDVFARIVRNVEAERERSNV